MTYDQMVIRFRELVSLKRPLTPTEISERDGLLSAAKALARR